MPPAPLIVDTGYTARRQFEPLHARLQRWGIVVAHRRSGKTVACINDLIDACMRCDKPNPRYAYIAPFFAQAKDVAWTYLKHYTSRMPGVSTNESELRVDFPSGGRIRLYGSENSERLRGLYLDGVVVDEFASMDPRAWSSVIRPALSDREGNALFIGTPAGQNHFADMWARAQAAPDEWFSMRLSAYDSGILPQSELDDARREMSDEQFAAEYECSFAASVIGSYWGRQMAEAENDGRITRVRYDDAIAVDTWFDLGMDDATAIWFTQNVGRELHVIDYAEFSGGGLPEAARVMQDRGYIYGTHHAPHDIRVRELGSGKSRIETAQALGIRFEVVPNLPVIDGINAARTLIGRCWFDRAKTEQGRNALVNYRRAWNEKRKVFDTNPLHDWSSHAADSWRYLAVGHKTAKIAAKPTQGRRLVSANNSSTWMAS